MGTVWGEEEGFVDRIKSESVQWVSQSMHGSTEERLKFFGYRAPEGLP